MSATFFKTCAASLTPCGWPGTGPANTLAIKPPMTPAGIRLAVLMLSRPLQLHHVAPSTRPSRRSTIRLTVARQYQFLRILLRDAAFEIPGRACCLEELRFQVFATLP